MMNSNCVQRCLPNFIRRKRREKPNAVNRFQSEITRRVPQMTTSRERFASIESRHSFKVKTKMFFEKMPFT